MMLIGLMEERRFLWL